MSECSQCGAIINGGTCEYCGAVMERKQTHVPEVQETKKTEKVLWEGQPAGLMDKAKSQAKLNDVTYTVNSQRIIIKSGLINKTEKEVSLKDIKNFKVVQKLADKLLNVGDVEIISSDPFLQNFTLSKIENPNQIKELIRNAMLEYK